MRAQNQGRLGERDGKSDVCVSALINEQMGCHLLIMGKQKQGCRGKLVGEWLGGWMDRQTDRWTEERYDLLTGQMDKQRNEEMNSSI